MLPPCPPLTSHHSRPFIPAYPFPSIHSRPSFPPTDLQAPIPSQYQSINQSINPNTSPASFPSTQPRPRILSSLAPLALALPRMPLTHPHPLRLRLHMHPMLLLMVLLLLRRPRPPRVRIARVILRSVVHHLLRAERRRTGGRRRRDKVRWDTPVAGVLLVLGLVWVLLGRGLMLVLLLVLLWLLLLLLHGGRVAVRAVSSWLVAKGGLGRRRGGGPAHGRADVEAGLGRRRGGWAGNAAVGAGVVGEGLPLLLLVRLWGGGLRWWGRAGELVLPRPRKVGFGVHGPRVE
jgi:hypothetical protein